MIIGLTGGIASGKSTVSIYLEKLGAKIVDADKMAKSLSNRKDIIEKLVLDFGNKILDGDGNLDRKKLKEIVFSDKNQLEKLNNIFHSEIRKEFKKIKSESLESEIIIFDVPLLFESHIDMECEEVILVYLDKDTQIERIIKRDNIKKDLALKIINSQMSLEEKKLKSSILLENNGTMEELKNKVEKIYTDIERKIKK